MGRRTNKKREEGRFSSTLKIRYDFSEWKRKVFLIKCSDQWENDGGQNSRLAADKVSFT